jgi:hypothetical protein
MEQRHTPPQVKQSPTQHLEPYMKATQIIIAIAAVATTVTLMAGIAGLVQKAEMDAYGVATTTYFADANKTTVVVTRAA